MPHLDPTDIRILTIIQQDARITEKALAAKVFKAPPTVHDRLAKLEANGYIKQYTAVLDRAKLGRPVLVVLMVRLLVQSTELLEEFERLVQDLPEVQSCLMVSGNWNFILQVTAVTPQAYVVWLLEKFNCQPNVGEVQSNFTLRETKNFGPLVIG